VSAIPDHKSHGAARTQNGTITYASYSSALWRLYASHLLSGRAAFLDGGEICLPEPLSRWTAVFTPLSFAAAAVTTIAGGLIPPIRWRGSNRGVEQGPLSFAGRSLTGIITPGQRATFAGPPPAVAGVQPQNYATSTSLPPSSLSLTARPDTSSLPPYCGTFFDNRIDESRLPLIRRSVTLKTSSIISCKTPA
jgi:hypothetical protein